MSDPPGTGPVPFVILASRSPRRRELLAQIGVAFAVADVAVDEAVRSGEEPAAYVARLARAKAAAAPATGVSGAPGVRPRAVRPSPGHAEVPVLAADTAVVVDGRILGKPDSVADAVGQLTMLSGRSHQVFTGVALSGSTSEVLVVESRVTFRPLSPTECRAYCATGEPMDKAGSYAIQGLGAVFVTRLEGSYSAVMGLPLAETARLLAEVGMPLLRAPVPHWPPPP